MIPCNYFRSLSVDIFRLFQISSSSIRRRSHFLIPFRRPLNTWGRSIPRRLLSSSLASNELTSVISSSEPSGRKRFQISINLSRSDCQLISLLHWGHGFRYSTTDRAVRKREKINMSGKNLVIKEYALLVDIIGQISTAAFKITYHSNAWFWSALNDRTWFTRAAYPEPSLELGSVPLSNNFLTLFTSPSSAASHIPLSKSISVRDWA